MTDASISHKASRKIIYCGCLCAFLTSLDFNIVNVALPEIRDKLSTDLNAVSYVIAVYLLTLVIFSPVAGGLCDRFGFGKVLLAGLAVFGTSSLVCGLAPDIFTLITARAVQGAGGAVLFVMGPGLFGHFLEEGERSNALVFLAAAQSSGMCIGPSLGGIITQSCGWEWIFYINLPLVVLAAYLAGNVISGRDNSERSERRFDLPGVFLFSAAMAFFMYVLSFIREGAAFSWRIAGVFILTFFLFAAFAWRESRAASPLVRLAYFRKPFFSFVCLGLFFVVVVISGTGLVFPFFLADIQKFPPGRIGLIYMLFPLMLAVSSIFLIRIKKYFGIFRIIFGGLLVLTASMVMYAMLDAASPLWLLCASNILRGIGYGFFYAPAMDLIIGNAEKSEHGMVSAILSMTMTISALMGIRIFEGAFSIFKYCGTRGTWSPYQLTFASGTLLLLAAALVMTGAAVKRPSENKNPRGEGA